jgi:NAD(P)-dependent dehydrogenase (short-subunit alcohol dehydrogenase family)
VEGLSQVLADELSGNSSIRVNTVNPGRARTVMRRQAYPSEDITSLPLPGTLLEPFIRLLGPRGKGITGQALDSQ